MTKRIDPQNGLARAQDGRPLGVQGCRIGKPRAADGGLWPQKMRPKPLSAPQQRVVAVLTEQLKRAPGSTLVPVTNTPAEPAGTDDTTRAQRQRAARRLGISLRKSSLQWPAVARHLRTLSSPAGTDRPHSMHGPADPVKEVAAAVLHALLAELRQPPAKEPSPLDVDANAPEAGPDDGESANEREDQVASPMLRHKRQELSKLEAAVIEMQRQHDEALEMAALKHQIEMATKALRDLADSIKEINSIG